MTYCQKFSRAARKKLDKKVVMQMLKILVEQSELSKIIWWFGLNCLAMAESEWDVDDWEIVLTESMNCSKYLKNWVDILERQLMRWSCQIPLTSIFFQIHLRIPSLSEPFLKTPFNSFLENVYTFQKCLHFTIWKDWFLQKFDFFFVTRST